MEISPIIINEEYGLQRVGQNYFPPSFKVQLKELFTKYLGFLFVPGKECKEFIIREEKLNQFKSKRSMARKFKSILTLLGIFIVFIVTTWAVFAPWVSPQNFESVTGIHPFAYAEPSPEDPLGRTEFGRSVLGRLIWGARFSLTIGLVSILVSIALGMVLGLISAYYGGIVDNVIMRIMDVMLAFPGLILAVVFIGIMGPEMRNIMLAYGILGIPGYARLMRGSALQEINRPYVYSERVSGASNFRIMFKHILPNCIAPLVIAFTFDIGGIILSLAGLGFLGFSDPKLVDWGSDISAARSKIYNAPWAALWPGFGIFITVLGFMLLGDGLRDALDPRLKI